MNVIMMIYVYNNYNYDFIKSFGNYKLYFRSCSHKAAHMSELIVVGIPSEIGDFISYETNDNPLTTGNFT